MQLVNIKTAKHGKTYLVYIPKHVAEKIATSRDDGYGSYYDSTLTEGFYSALCFHNIHAIGKPKDWQIYDSGSAGNNPESDDPEIRGVLYEEAKVLFGW